jgi:hypothetical protein
VLEQWGYKSRGILEATSSKLMEVVSFTSFFNLFFSIFFYWFFVPN